MEKQEKNHPSYGTGKSVVQLTLDDAFIAEYISASEAGVKTKINPTGIRRVCNNQNNHIAGGYHWMYKEDYENFISNSNKD